MGLTLGATPVEGRRCQFLVRAPLAENVEVRILNPHDSFSAEWSVCAFNRSKERLVRLEKRTAVITRGSSTGCSRERRTSIASTEKGAAGPRLSPAAGRCSWTLSDHRPQGVSMGRCGLAWALP